MSDVDRVQAVCDYNAQQGTDALSFKEGDLIRIITRYYREGWWVGKLNGHVGLIPINCVRLLNADEYPDNSDDPSEDGNDAQGKPCKDNARMISPKDLLRKDGKVLKESELTATVQLITKPTLLISADFPEEFLSLMPEKMQKMIPGRVMKPAKATKATLSEKEIAKKLHKDMMTLFEFITNSANQFRIVIREMRTFMEQHRLMSECIKTNANALYAKQRKVNEFMQSEMEQIKQQLPQTPPQ